MERRDYPALFLDADDASNAYQKNFLLLIQAEYFFLFLAALFSLPFLINVVFHIIYACVFVVGLIILIVRAQGKPDQWWYRCRALAESVKTLTWRYMMHAAPFDGDDGHAKMQFREQLHSVFRENSETATRITDDWSGNAQITDVMNEVRLKTREDRLAYYLNYRVEEQRNWYRKKSKANRAAASRWIWISGFCYVVAGGMVLSRIALPTWLWPVEPLIVIAASIVGWMQIKKYNELSAAYTVTAHEIGMIQAIPEAVTDDLKFSEFVNDAEKAFSREHTLWIARQSD